MRRSPRRWRCRSGPCGPGCTAPAAKSARSWPTPSSPGRPRRHEVDELKLLAELRHETPPITAAAAQSARARLLAAAAGPPATRGRRSRMPSGLARRGRRVAAATALALVLTVGVTVTRDAGVDPEHPA